MQGPNSERHLWNYSAFHQIKTFYAFGTKVFLRRYTGIYRELSLKCSENVVLGRLEMVLRKYFFLRSARNIFAGKFVKWVRILAVSWEYIFYNVERIEVRKMSRFFERNFIVKWVTCFASFCWFGDFLLHNLKSKVKLEMWGFESFTFCFKFYFLGLF